MSIAMQAMSSIAGKMQETAASAFAAPDTKSAGSASGPFAELFTGAVGQIDSLDSQARSAVEGLMSGSGVDVHEAMIATEKADMAFELALSVRNKAVSAYQTVMGMQF